MRPLSNIAICLIVIFFGSGLLMAQTQDALQIDINGNVGINTSTPTEKLDVNGNVQATDVIATRNVNATGTIQQNGSILLPKGAIIMWYGGNTAPAGWAICDGSKDTPDLRDRFVVGAGKSYAAKDTGGENMVTLTQAQMPEHAHSISTQNGKLMGDGVYERDDFRDGGHLKGFDRGRAGIVDAIGRTEYTGNNQAHENRPPYYALYYIMKL